METAERSDLFGKIVINVLLLLPATLFWVSVLTVASFGNDYMYDLLLAKIGLTWWGNLLLIFMVVALPAVAVAINGMENVLHKSRVHTIAMIIGAILLALGFYAVMVKG